MFFPGHLCSTFMDEEPQPETKEEVGEGQGDGPKDLRAGERGETR